LRLLSISIKTILRTLCARVNSSVTFLIERSVEVLFPLLEERARERGEYLKPSVYIYSPPQPSP
jgi:hypothetical protein